MPDEALEQWIRVRKSGRVHLRTRLGAGWATNEACNVDDAETIVALSDDEAENVPEGDLCLRCFGWPEPEQGEAG